MNTPTPPRPSAPQPEFADVPPKRSTVVIWLLVTVALLLSIVALLAYRSVAVREPARTLTVRSTPQWLGAKLTLYPTGKTEPLHATYVDSLGQHTVTFFLAPGEYDLRIGFENGPELLTRQFDLRDVQEGYLELTDPPATHPVTTRPAP